MIKVNGQEIKMEKFPDGTPLFKGIPIIKNADTSVNFLWLYENNEELVYLMMLVQHYKEVAHSSLRFYLEVPYVPNSRMDRTHSVAEVFTLKYFCNIINSFGFNEVKIFDVHSNVTPALLNRVRQDKRVASIIYKAIKKYNPDVLFFPDEGSCKRYSEMLKEFYSHLEIDMPAIAYANKDRDWNTGKIKGLIVQNGEVVKDKNVLIIDDICSKGGTFLHSAKALKELGANEINLYISHCENTILEGEMINSGLIKNIYTTNSIFTEKHEKIFVDNIFE